MTRSDAIKILANRDLKNLDSAGRESKLLDWWYIDEEDIEYHSLSDDLKLEMAEHEVPADVDRPIFDPLLLLALRYAYYGVRNDYLKSQIEGMGYFDEVVGSAEAMLPCLCCGYKTLRSRGSYDICKVCFWEDDGQTLLDKMSGPNHMTLREAKANFDRYGAVDEQARSFVLSDGRDRYQRT